MFVRIPLFRTILTERSGCFAIYWYTDSHLLSQSERHYQSI